MEEAVLRALAKNPDDRFPNVTAFAEALEKACALPGESYYPEHVALAMRECYYQWCDKADWGEMREITADDAKELQHKLQDRRQATTGYRRPFANGAIYWSKRGGTQPVWGGFNQIHNNEKGVEGILGFPLTCELPAESSPPPYQTEGVFQRFEGQWDYPEDINTNPVQLCGASLYCSKYGAYPTWGGIGRAWICHSKHGNHSVWGGMGLLYENMGGASGPLGFPTSAEMEAAEAPQGTTGWFQPFEGGSIHWCEKYPGVAVMGPILIVYIQLGGSGSKFGFPVSPQTTVKGHEDMYQQEFEGGVICVVQSKD